MPEDKINRFLRVMEMNNMTGEEVARLFLDWHGAQLLTDEFFENIEDEGYIVD